MNRFRNIMMAFSLFAGGIFCFQVIHNCERFEPAGELYFYTDTIIAQATRGTYLFSGAVVHTGKDGITDHGFCWSHSGEPTLERDTAVGLGPLSEPDSFAVTVTGLDAGTTYHVRSFVRTGEVTEYSTDKSFTTPGAELPQVTTSPVTHIGQDSARSGGTITGDGGDSITARGVCWATTPSPTVDSSHTTDGAGKGTFTSRMKGLSCKTKYYVRAYATSSAGTAYGDTVSFTTLECQEGLPTLSTAEVTAITDSSARSGGAITDDGGFQITARGVCWSTESEPTTAVSHTNDGTGTGTFTSAITGLSPATQYHVRAYATNSAGTAYGGQETFTTIGGSAGPVSDYDGNVYQTVQIGEQVWMAENLKVTHYADGTPIPLVEGSTEWDMLSAIDIGYCWYDNSTANRDIYGGLYNWAAAMNGAAGSDANPSGVQGACPDGWHLPSDAEWDQLADYLGGAGLAGGKLRQAGTDYWESPNTGATNESGFTALPAGKRDDNGTFESLGSHTNFWTSLHDGSTWAWSHHMGSSGTYLQRDNYPRGDGYSVRCIQGAGSASTIPTVTTTAISNITENSAEGGGEVTDDGGAAVTARGVCWSTSSGPEITDSKTEDGTGTGSFASAITSLSPGTEYYVRAYAINALGISYGEEEIFTTESGSAGTVTDIDGNVYPTVWIGEQVWMAENLKTTHYANGTPIPLVEGSTDWNNLTSSDKGYCWYDNSIDNRDTYGGLYNWAAAMNGAAGSDAIPSGVQGACPDGWHLPSDAEWKEMEIYLGMLPSTANNTGLRGSQGGKLKEAGTTHWRDPNTFATNESGFTALPAGYRNLDGVFAAESFSAFFWTATQSDISNAWHRDLFYDWGGVYRSGIQMDRGYSVRCVEGQGYSLPAVTTSTPSNVQSTSAQSGGDVSDDGGSAVTARGVCWSTSEHPTLDDDITSDGTGTGSFTSQINGLTPQTTYYVRAYATNSVGTAYGEQHSFFTSLICPGGMVSYWPLDESGPPYADILSGHDGSSTSAPASVTGRVGNAQQFNGTDTYITVPDHDDFDWDGNNSFTIEMWVKLTAIRTDNNMVFIGRDDASGSVHWWLGAEKSTGRIMFVLVNSAATTSVLNGSFISEGVWNHLVVTRNYVTGYNTLYMNGIQITSELVDYSDGNFSSDATIDIGAFNLDGVPGLYPAPVVIDEAALYNRSLSPAEISDHYDRGIAGNSYCE